MKFITLCVIVGLGVSGAVIAQEDSDRLRELFELRKRLAHSITLLEKEIECSESSLEQVKFFLHNLKQIIKKAPQSTEKKG